MRGGADKRKNWSIGMSPGKTLIFAIPAAFLALGAWWWFAPGAPPMDAAATPPPPVADQPITTISSAVALDPRKVELGRRLFHDPRLSKDDQVACATCHDLKKFGVDGRARARGIGGQVGDRNSPTVFNSSLNFRQFWDGRAASLEEQAEGPVHNPLEMASNWKEVMAKLERDDEYPRQFREIWPDGLSPAHIQSAIAEFERSLVTPDSPFDQYLRGQDRALPEAARRGWDLFRNLGCVACHQGVNVGGNMYANLGVMGDYFADRGLPLSRSDLGREAVSGRPEDRHVFKVPGLRLAAHTAPYFHDGSIPSLEEAVTVMARYQLGVALDPRERADLVAFLHSLSVSPRGAR